MAKRFLTLLVLCTECLCTMAQLSNIQLPLEKEIRKGTLDNGLTYYIRHNEKPAGQADFFIAQKVGSMLEEDNQQGLAHFLEHMCFNGTKNFPGKMIINWLEKNGVLFGQNLNAYTSLDETVYNISSVPIGRETVIDSCLLILHDWADGLTLASTEIDAERGVIHEEWRQRRNANMRVMEQMLPKVYPGCKYGYRFPIGQMEVVDNFEHQALRDYYEKWYRPDLQGIIVVGDINVDSVEAKIKQVFSDIKMPENVAERYYTRVPDNEEPIVFVGKDKELSTTTLSIYYKHDPLSREARNTLQYYQTNYITGLSTAMLNLRLSEMTRKPGCPFLSASVSDGDYLISKTKSAFSININCRPDSVERAMSTAMRELHRAGSFGFSETEYERVRTTYTNAMEVSYKERDNRTSTQFCKELVRVFIDGEACPGIGFENLVAKQFAEKIPLSIMNEQISLLSKGGDKNLVITLRGPEKEDVNLPNEEELLRMYHAIKYDDLEAYVDDTPTKPLLAATPAKGRIVKESNGAFGSKIYTLQNGARLIVKSTSHSADEITMQAFSAGGSSLYDNTEIANLKVLGSVAQLGGLGEFSNQQLGKILAGKTASCRINIGEMSEGLSGSCNQKNLETMLQLLYMQFTQPRKDTEQFDLLMKRTRESLIQQKDLPATAYADSLVHILYNDHPRKVMLNEKLLDQVNYDRIMQIRTERFADASDFTFIMVGNISLDSTDIRNLIETYIGALPSSGQHEHWTDTRSGIQPGQRYADITQKTGTPKTSVSMICTGKCAYNMRNNMLMTFATQALNEIYLEEVREKEGGSYGVNVGGSLEALPKPLATLQITFDTDPTRRDKIIGIVRSELDKFVQTGPTQESVDKTREFLLKQWKQNLEKNAYWMTQLMRRYWYGIDMTSDYDKVLQSITPKEVQKFMKKILSQKNFIQIIRTTE